jgi:hypothetical protein
MYTTTTTTIMYVGWSLRSCTCNTPFLPCVSVGLIKISSNSEGKGLVSPHNGYVLKAKNVEQKHFRVCGNLLFVIDWLPCQVEKKEAWQLQFELEVHASLLCQTSITLKPRTGARLPTERSFATQASSLVGIWDQTEPAPTSAPVGRSVHRMSCVFSSGSWPRVNPILYRSQFFGALLTFDHFKFFGCFFSTLTILPYNLVTLVP